jgi:hypothetical protein
MKDVRIIAGRLLKADRNGFEQPKNQSAVQTIAWKPPRLLDGSYRSIRNPAVIAIPAIANDAFRQ